MSVPRLSSEELNMIMIDSKQQIDNINTKLNIVKADLESKLKVIRHESDYMGTKLSLLSSGGYTPDLKIKLFQNNAMGQFDAYGSTVHAKFIKPPINVFNLQTTENVFFRRDATVLVNSQSADRFNSMLEHENSPTKIMFFEEFQTDTLNIEINVDRNASLGSTRFNMIEISPFLPGSFDISSLEIYSINEDGTLNNTPDAYGPIVSVGKERLLLPKKYGFFKIKMTVLLKYESSMGDSPLYPFGIKHIYFYNADFYPGSFAAVPIISSDYFSIIKDDITVITPTGKHNSTISNEGIEIYLDLVDGTLKTPVYVSTATQRNEIVKNTKKLYAKVPLSTGDVDDTIIRNSSLVGISFNTETRIV
jgi:hypothetical protein